MRGRLEKMKNGLKVSELIQLDAGTYVGKEKVSSLLELVKIYFRNPGFKVTLFMRICKGLSHYKLLKLLYWICLFKYKRLQIRYGIIIGHKLNIMGGFNIEHFGGIVVAAPAVIGKNFHIRQNTTIGQTGGKYPTIGDNVQVGTGAVIIGDITIGNNVIIGANAVVNKSFSDNVIIAGVPARIIGRNDTLDHKL